MVTKKRIEEKSKDKSNLIMGGIVGTTILGSLGIIGAFWGKEGYEVLGLGILCMCILAIWFAITKTDI